MYSRLNSSLGLAFVFAAFAAAQPQYLVTTIAGGSVPPTPAPALSTGITQPQRVTVDGNGNVYFTASNAVFKMSGGTLTLIAGTGRMGYAGDGGPATQALFNNPQGIAVDGSGNIYVADTGNSVVRIITPNGFINLFAGNVFGGVPQPGWSGDGGPAIGAALDLPVGMAVDSSGNLYIADSANNAIREVTAGGNIQTIAGLGPTAPGFAGDTQAAVAANLNGPLDVAVDSKSNVYIADTNNANVRMITASTGTINTVAGSTAVVSGAVVLAFGYMGDGASAILAELAGPAGVAIDSAGNIYIATYADNRIRKVDTKGNISTFAGNSGYGFAGDGGPVLNAQLASPRGISLDSSGNLYLADRWNNRIRKIAGGTISTIAGNGQANFGGDGGAATSAQLSYPNGIAVDHTGNIYIADLLNNRVRMVTPTGTISTYAGNGIPGFGGDGGAATNAQLNQPSGLAIDSSGNLYIADSNNAVVRMVNTQGVISTVAGTGGVGGYSGDGGAATKATLLAPIGVAVDSSSNIYIADYYGWIREVNASTGVISTIAGNGTNGYTGDGGSATSAQFYNPIGVAVDSSGNVYVADSGNGAVRMISNGTISTIGGTGILSYTGDGGPAALAQFSAISSIAVDAQGNIYVADTNNNAIRLFPLGGTVSTVAGNGMQGYTGDGGAATVAELNNPRGVAVTSSGNVYFTDTGNNSVRLLTRQ
ncbi:MAG TPA: NHL repeat-containing protein [Bryobacteraceae bacterium]|nr:NHL repeat-containing protein [Bryobacteraceae bacterium]